MTDVGTLWAKHVTRTSESWSEQWTWDQEIKVWRRASSTIALAVYPGSEVWSWKYQIYTDRKHVCSEQDRFVTQGQAMYRADVDAWQYLNRSLNAANHEATFWARAVANYRSGR